MAKWLTFWGPPCTVSTAAVPLTHWYPASKYETKSRWHGCWSTRLRTLTKQEVRPEHAPSSNLRTLLTQPTLKSPLMQRPLVIRPNLADVIRITWPGSWSHVALNHSFRQKSITAPITFNHISPFWRLKVKLVNYYWNRWQLQPKVAQIRVQNNLQTRP